MCYPTSGYTQFKEVKILWEHGAGYEHRGTGFG